jgi:hypothetical protein
MFDFWPLHRDGEEAFYVMQRITIDGKDYKLVPVDDPFESLESGPEFSTLAAQEKADLYKSKYSDYKNIPRQELINRIIKIDQMSEWEYCEHQFLTWVDWEGLYKAVSTDKHCPYKSLGQFRETGMSLVKEVFERKKSIETGFFRVEYLEGCTNDEGIWEEPEISLNVIFYGSSHLIGEQNRDYLTPEDDQTYTDAG